MVSIPDTDLGNAASADVPIVLRRADSLPPYALGSPDQCDERGRHVIDLGFGNPDLASPDVAVDELNREAANPLSHRYAPGEGRHEPRLALTQLYARRFGVGLDPVSETVLTVGAKQAIQQLLAITVEAGDSEPPRG